MKPIESQKEYQKYVEQKSPNSPIIKNCFNAFWVGGLICSIGQIILSICQNRGFDTQISGTIVSIILIGISAFLTGLNIFNKIGKFAVAGSLIPITGFANSIVSPAMEYKSEGYVMGVGGKMFTVAGPVLVFGISASIVNSLFTSSSFFIRLVTSVLLTNSYLSPSLQSGISDLGIFIVLSSHIKTHISASILSR